MSRVPKTAVFVTLACALGFSIVGFVLVFVGTMAFAQSTQAPGVFLPTPPKGGAAIVNAGAVRLLETGPATLEIKAPLRIYNGGPLDSLSAGRLDARETNEYFYGVFASGKPIGWARVSVDPAGTGRLLSVTSNAPDARGNPPPLPLAASVDSALKQLATNPHLLSAPIEARLVSIIGATGGGPFYVLWLKPDEGADWIYTLEQRFKPADVETSRLYSTEDFMKRIQPVAKQRLEQNRQQPANPRGAAPGA